MKLFMIIIWKSQNKVLSLYPNQSNQSKWNFY